MPFRATSINLLIKRQCVGPTYTHYNTVVMPPVDGSRIEKQVLFFKQLDLQVLIAELFFSTSSTLLEPQTIEPHI